MNVVVGLLVASGLVLALPPQRFGQSPHDAGGVGAEGLIGRGTIPEERPAVLDSSPVRLAPVYIAAPVAAPAIIPSLPGPAASTPSRAVVRTVPPAGRRPRARGDLLRPRLPARARRNPYADSDRGWLHGYWSLPLDGASGRPDGGIPAPRVGPGPVSGWGLTAWIIGPMVYRSGYFPYHNPFDQGKAPGHPGGPAIAGELHRYRDAAQAFYSVVAVVPGWDWATLVKLYGDPETYTRQLRLLESYCERNPRSAAGHFLLAIQYLTTGFPDEAAAQLREAAALRPADSLCARLIRALRPAPPAATATAGSGTGEAGTLEGTWTARPRQDTTITLVLRPQGHVAWRVSERETVREYRGLGLYADGVLTLTEDPEDALVGRVDWRDPAHFRFRLLEAPDDDPGLSFARFSRRDRIQR